MSYLRVGDNSTIFLHGILVIAWLTIPLLLSHIKTVTPHLQDISNAIAENKIRKWNIQNNINYQKLDKRLVINYPSPNHSFVYRDGLISNTFLW